MTIQGNLGSGVITLGAAADAVLVDLAVSIDRCAVSSAIIHNDTGAGDITVDIYISPNLTSASGNKIDQVVVAIGETMDIPALIGIGVLEGTQNIIAQADIAGANAYVTRTEYTDGD